MRLLLDQNLPFKLVRSLADIHPASVHVCDLGVLEADDASIWRYAAEHGFVIVSEDSDFHQMSLPYGHPPETVWLRVDDAPSSAVAALLREQGAKTRHFYQDPEAALLALA